MTSTSSSATLFYGIPVHAWTLDRAARAHASLGGPLLGLGLIAFRRRQGTLRSSSSFIEQTPVEVWLRIKDELYDLALDDALEAMLAEMRCEGCWVKHKRAVANFESIGSQGEPPMHEWGTWERPDCVDCAEAQGEVLWQKYETVEGNFAKGLLESYGLVLASRISCCTTARDDTAERFRSVAVAAPLLASSVNPDPELLPYTTLSFERTDGDQAQHAIVSPDLFHITDHQRQFQSLMTRYRLDTAKESGVRFASAAGVPTRSAEVEGESTEIELSRPQWRLWLTEGGYT